MAQLVHFKKIIATFAVHRFHTIVNLKTDRLLYSSELKKELSKPTTELSMTHKNFDFVTIKVKNTRCTFINKWILGLLRMQVSIEVFRPATARINRHWTVIKSVRRRESESNGWSCYLHTISVLLVPVKSVLLKQNITKSAT